MSRENLEIVRLALLHVSDKGEPDLELYDPDFVCMSAVRPRPTGSGHTEQREDVGSPTKGGREASRTERPAVEFAARAS